MKKHIIVTAVSSVLIIGACLAHDTFSPRYEMTTTAILGLGEIIFVLGNLLVAGTSKE